MNITEYFTSLSTECDALKNRVRNFIEDAHWLSDGEWKESVLRTMIKRSTANSCSVGRGFIVKKEVSSTQTDILVYDSFRPILYQDNDLVFIPPISCKGIIEVKTRINRYDLFDNLNKLSDTAQFVLDSEPNLNLFVGLFAYDTNYRDLDSLRILEALQNSAIGNSRRVINHVCLGKSIFAKYWETHPVLGTPNYNSWRVYYLRNMSVGYFLHNLMSYVANRNLIGNDNVWFPEGGKEGNGKESRFISDAPLVANLNDIMNI